MVCFMSDRGTRNVIFVLRRLVERSIQKQKDVCTCFIDYRKAFDTVMHASLLLANLYWNQQGAVGHNG